MHFQTLVTYTHFFMIHGFWISEYRLSLPASYSKTKALSGESKDQLSSQLWSTKAQACVLGLTRHSIFFKAQGGGEWWCVCVCVCVCVCWEMGDCNTGQEVWNILPRDRLEPSVTPQNYDEAPRLVITG